MNIRPNPQRISNNFRLQTSIDEEVVKVDKFLETNVEFSNADLIDVARTLLEVSKKDETFFYATLALNAENEKPVNSQDKEVLAAAHYIFATLKREANDTQGARVEYEQALSLTQSDWLYSNILRNNALVYLKEKNFAKAAEVFKQALDFVNVESRPELRGSLPALSNYYGLCLTRAALAEKQYPTEGLKVFAETTKLYEKIFTEKNVPELARQKSNDWQSHQFHRGMVLCEMVEQGVEKDEHEKVNKLHLSRELLLGALAGRVANKADDARLGDVCSWIGRVYAALGQTADAEFYFNKTLSHFKIAFPKTKPDAPDAPQIKDVTSRLATLRQFTEMKAPAVFGQGVFTAAAAGVLQDQQQPIASLVIKR